MESEALGFIIVGILVVFSGIFSGLTLGLLGLDLNGLEIVMASDSSDAVNAAKILPIRKHGNLLLCTLLLGNVAVNAAVSVVLSEISSGLMAFFVSTALIVLFGEIIPQSVCSRYALVIGAKFVYLVWILLIVMSPVQHRLYLCSSCLLYSRNCWFCIYPDFVSCKQSAGLGTW